MNLPLAVKMESQVSESTLSLVGESVAVIGLAKSGFESAKFLAKRGVKVFVSEFKSSPEALARKVELEKLGCQVEIGKHSIRTITRTRRVIMSPGIPPSAPVYQSIQKKKVPMWSEIELAYQFCRAPIIAVTGTNGKTTVTSLITQILKKNGCHAISCGNIGNPLIGEIDNLTEKSIAVVEVSSFQLQNIEQFRPYIGIVLNLTVNHLDWHANFEEYAAAKWNLFRNQLPHDYAFLNADDVESMHRANLIKSQKVYFNGGEHENPDFAACLAVANLYRFDEHQTRQIFDSFPGIEHRLEKVSSRDGFRYVNDSKSTTIASLSWALDRTKDKAVLIMGGKHKGGDFSVLRDKIKSKVRFLVLIGEAAPALERVFASTVRTVMAPSLEQAVRQARAAAKENDTILFSPACASFDMFENYEDRGRKFKAIIQSFQK